MSSPVDVRPGQDLLPRSLRGLVSRMPEVLLGSVLVCVAAAAVTLVAPGPSPLSVLLHGLVAPVAAAPLVALGNQLALGVDEPARAAYVAARRAFRASALVGLAGAGPACCALVALEVWRQTGAVWTLPCLALTGAASIVGVLLALVALPVVVADPALPASAVFRFAVTVLVRRPVPVVGTAVLAVLGLWAAVAWSASVLLLVPGPVVVTLCAAVWTAAYDLGPAQL